MNKKGASIDTVVVYVIAGLVIILILYFGYQSIAGLYSTAAKGELEQLKLQVKADVSKISSEYGAIKTFSYQLPAGFNQLCYVDLTKKDQIANSADVASYPIINDSVSTNSTNNVFMFGNAVEAWGVGDMRVNCAPWFACFNKTGPNVDVTMRGRGGYALILLCPEVEALPPYISFNETDNVSSTGSVINQIVPEPQQPIYISTGTALKFTVGARDPQNSKLDVNWTVDKQQVNSVGEEINSGDKTSTTKNFTQPGQYAVLVSVTNNASLSAYFGWTVRAVGAAGYNVPQFSTMDQISVAGTPEPQRDISMSAGRPTSFSTQLTSSPFFFNVSEGQTVQFRVVSTNPNNDFLTYTADQSDINTKGSTFFTSTTSGGAFNWTPNYYTAQDNPYSVSFLVADTRGVEDTVIVWINVTPSQNRPVLDCTIGLATDCSGKTNIMGLSYATNAHAELPSQTNYLYHLCCGLASGTIGTDCSTGATLLHLSANTNAHAEIPTQANYNVNVCMSSSTGTISCSAKSSCDATQGEAAVVSLSADTNAHVGGPNDYPDKICCKIS